MRIDPADGTVAVVGCTIGPTAELTDLLAAGAEHERYGNGWQWARFVELEAGGDGPRWFVSVSYSPEDAVEMVLLEHSDGPPGDWSTWSEEAVLAQRDWHDRWLVEALGDPWTAAPVEHYDGASKGQVRTLPWGRVWSDYDTRSGGSSIGIRYSG